MPVLFKYMAMPQVETALYPFLSPVMIHWFVILKLLKRQCKSCRNSNKNSNWLTLAFQRLGD